MEIQARHRLYSIIKGVYWENYEENKIKGINALKLIDTVDSATDHVNESIKDFFYVKKSIVESYFFKVLIKISRF